MATCWLMGLSSTTRILAPRRVDSEPARCNPSSRSGFAWCPSTWRMELNRADCLTGLVRNPSNSGDSASRAWSSEPKATISSTMIRGRPGIPRIFSTSARPSMSPSHQSTTASRGARPILPEHASLRRCSMAFAPEEAVSTARSKDSNIRCKTSLEASLSSTTRTRVPRSCGRVTGRGNSPRDSPNTAENVNVLPFPGVLSTRMRPCIISTMRLQMANPSPVPP